MIVNAKLKGVDKLLKDFREFGKEGEKEFGSITKLTAKDIEGNAKINAPIDLGKLRQSIHAAKLAALRYEVNVGVKYGAYMEFGTGTKVTVPSELKEVARHFIGKGVKKINLRPQPYLYPAFIRGRMQYLKDLKESIKHLTKKFNK
jgi:HK97 gp10 family phage protein